ncbi:hypothetical protein AVEN_76334-1 [Araneus ventricosus]|uniref:Uncharacterized protein n=1 Tax=Araneus ventricosus TaxID=182803 RepID=A0A4Y2NTJ5_ARAVE|nr:hypothetical protein AVEN_76334-1 [Araneus ventricosus]
MSQEACSADCFSWLQRWENGTDVSYLGEYRTKTIRKLGSFSRKRGIRIEEVDTLIRAIRRFSVHEIAEDLGTNRSSSYTWCPHLS